jgi:Glycosyltransferases involved in cell wall biogenesis
LLISVVVPAYNAASSIEDCLTALIANDLPREQWELIVVDDGSTDDTARIASALADRLVTIQGGARGPAFARNRGAELARSGMIAFVDADVSVHSDALRLMTEDLALGSPYAAVFGSYDDHPSDKSTISQYRNLLHHYVHNRYAGETATFWAGCGAMIKEAFDRAGRFDAVRYPRPQIEDIELGYRLGAGGAKILIDPRIQGTHHKQWRFLQMMRTDLLDRAIPWAKLLVSSPARNRCDAKPWPA